MTSSDSQPLTVSEFLQSAMQNKNLTIWELARAAKVDKGYLKRILNGQRPVGIGTSLRIARVLDLEPDSIAVVQARRHVFEHQAAQASGVQPPKPVTTRNPRRLYFSPGS